MKTNMSSNKKALKNYLAVEDELCLMEKKEGRIPLWEYIRYPLYMEYLHSLGHNTPTTTQSRTTTTWKRFSHLLLAVTKYNPLFAPKNSFLLIGHPRRKFEDNKYIDIYTDPFIEMALKEEQCVVLERPLAGGIHRSPTPTLHLFHTDILDLFSWVLRKASVAGLSSNNQKVCHKIQKKLNTNINIERFARQYLFRWKSDYPVYKWLFNRLKPKAVFIIVSAGQEPIITAAKDLGIKTIELQHGSPAPGKLNYDYPENTYKYSFPDYFLSFGPYWIKHVNLPLSSSKIKYLGFPYLHVKKDLYKNVAKKNQIVVISQPTIGDILAKFVEKLSLHFGGKVSIIYKLHPMEIYQWKDKYSSLLKAGVTLIPGNERELYELFAESKWQLGVYSTAIVEGLVFACKPYILEAPGHEYMQSLIGDGYATLVKSPEDLQLNYEDNVELDYGDIFAPITSETMGAIMEEIS